MHHRIQQGLLLLANVVLCVSILLFAVGFFPYKASLPGLAEWSGEASLSARSSPFDRVIFMVVDALRSDFVYGNQSHFLFTQSLIRSGAAVPFTGHASPPTITMPRVKAITTGTVPSFVDLVLNFAESDTTSTLALQDSWLAQMRAKPGNGKLVMYGDDTWLRLFPNFFDRSEGTTSFFVSDFTEVDNNVTRHVPDELARDDWSVMVMHYLGLDHIGHKTGPKGPNMPTKQREMDEIVQDIYSAMDQTRHLESCLLVVLGDHGMNEGGNHGANSAGEVSTALTFISPKFIPVFGGQESPLAPNNDYRFYNEVEQSDLAPTLAALLGFPIPRNSLGTIIPQFFDLWTSEQDRFDMLFANAQQIQLVAQATYPSVFTTNSETGFCFHIHDLSDEEKLGCYWQKVLEGRRALDRSQRGLQLATQAVNTFIKHAQGLLSSTASKYDLDKMFTGVVLASSSVGVALILASAQVFRRTWSSAIFVFILLSDGATMFASSYVEEEHQYWYWVSSAWLLLLALRARRFASTNAKIGFAGTLACVLLGVLRRWNQTGQKYAGGPDLVTEVLSQHPWLTWTLIVATYVLPVFGLWKKLARKGLRQLAPFPFLVGASAVAFKLAFTAADAPELLQGITVFDSVLRFVSKYQLVNLSRVVFVGLVHLVGLFLIVGSPWADQAHGRSFREALHEITTLFLATQSRTINVPLFLISHLQMNTLLSGPPLEPLELSLTSLLMQHTSFFAFGGTNAISSVDLSNAYNGVSGYNVVAVGILTFVSNWAGPVWWSSATVNVLSYHTLEQGTRRRLRPRSHFAILTLFVSVGVLAVMIACTILREHLFIWTVFSPKYLYTIAWTFGQHVVVNGFLTSMTPAEQ